MTSGASRAGLLALALLTAAVQGGIPLHAQQTPQTPTPTQTGGQGQGQVPGVGTGAQVGGQGAGPVQLPSMVTAEQLIERLRLSGMSREEVRTRLVQLGFDPALADPYFDRLEGQTNQAVQVSDRFTLALQQMGLLSGTDLAAGLPDSLRAFSDSLLPDSLRMRADTVLPVFGRSIFSGFTNQFEAVALGPVDPGYRLGPGDELRLVLTGGVELAYTLQVTRDGLIVIPIVGQVFVSGLTLEELRNTLYDRLGAVYSGVRRDGTATTFFDASLGRVRFNQVYVIGDVVRPGQVQVSGIATVFQALYRAGGPTDLGSFRNVVVRRAATGDSIQVDLYDYLLRGDASRDVRLENQDIIFVPPAGPQVEVWGRVRRQAIYEVREGEDLQDVLAFAGGLQADAHLQRVQIDRILPPDARVPGVDRVLLDVNVDELTNGQGPAPAQAVPLRDGDEVRVFTTLAERRNRVTLTGSVRRPGLYEFRPGMTLGELINRADGVAEEAFLPVAHVVRPVLETGSARLLRAPLQTDAAGRVVADLLLADRDSVVVYGVDSLAAPAYVHIEGLVKEPGEYRYAEEMTVRDLILAAGGYELGADAFEAEVVRLRHSVERDEVIAESFRVTLDGDVPARWALPGAPPAAGAPGLPPGAPGGGDFTLEDGDRVFVRQMPGFVTPRTVIVQGEAIRPGPYGLESREERLSTVVQRAGGPTEEAYIRGAGLMRDSILVGIDLTAALERPGSTEDVPLQDGDIIVIPRYDPTVLVQGAIAFESRVLYQEGLGVEDYLSRSGGSLRGADLDQLSVLYPSGERATARKFLWIRRYPSVQPGSAIFVPRAVEGEGTDWNQILSSTLAVTSTLATLIIATR